jgi:hypothetical protein
MIRQGLVSIIFSCFLLVGCLGGTPPLATPTPFPTATADPFQPPTGTQAVTLAELLAEPALYQNQSVQVTGQFYRLPRLVCGSLVSTYRLPASFTLREGELIIYGGGIGAARDVAPDGLTMTINGRLLSWRGPVGCGKRAVIQEIWYIETSHVVAPRPLTSATLTPAAVIAGVNGEDEEPPTPTATPEIEDDPDPQPTPTPTLATDLPQTTPTSTFTPTPTPDDEEDGDEDDENRTPTPTGTPGFDREAIVVQGDLASGNLVGGRLEIGELHEWRFAITASDVLTVSAIADQGNLVLMLLDEEDNILYEQDDAPPRAVEMVAGFSLAEPGEYRLLLQVTEEVTADYHLLFMLSDSYAFVMQGLLVSGQDQNNISLAVESDHSWHIAAEEGDTIQVIVRPLNNMDAFMRIYDPAGDIIFDNGQRIYINDGGAGDAEELVYVIPETGLYAIQVGEVDFAGGLYAIIFLLNP